MMICTHCGADCDGCVTFERVEGKAHLCYACAPTEMPKMLALDGVEFTTADAIALRASMREGTGSMAFTIRSRCRDCRRELADGEIMKLIGFSDGHFERSCAPCLARREGRTE